MIGTISRSAVWILSILALATLLPLNNNYKVTVAQSLIGEFSDAPIKVSHIRSNKSRDSGKSTEEDGLLNIEALLVENTSAKIIKYLEVKLIFPGVKVNGMKVSMPMRYGRIHMAPDKLEGRDSLRPGEKLRLPITRDMYEGMNNIFLEKGNAAIFFDQVITEVALIIYEDRTAWSRGLLHYQSPGNPNCWYTAEAIANKSSLNRKMSVYKAVYNAGPASPSAIQSECGRYGGFELLPCCADLYVASAIIIPDPNGNAVARLATAFCPEGGSCNYNEVDPCQAR